MTPRGALRLLSCVGLLAVMVTTACAAKPVTVEVDAGDQLTGLDLACAGLAAETDVDAILARGEPAGALALDIADCLGRQDPHIRDDFAYTSLARLLRAELVPEETREQLLVSLSASVDAHAIDTDNGGSGFLHPFAALVLSEVARTDRIAPWMTDDQRADIVETGASYVESVRDYRGFIDAEGWRHGVAHGSDLLLQLSLNPEIGEPEAMRIMAAVGRAISADEAPAFIFDEPRRLGRPILYLTQRGLLSEEMLTSWFEAISRPAPLASWEGAFSSESALARRHNLRAFGYALLVTATESEDENLKRLRPGALQLLSTIP